MASYCDVIVLRHPVKGSALVASNKSLNKSVINAGIHYRSVTYFVETVFYFVFR